jgi:hypothetical protein
MNESKLKEGFGPRVFKASDGRYRAFTEIPRLLIAVWLVPDLSI